MWWTLLLSEVIPSVLKVKLSSLHCRFFSEGQTACVPQCYLDSCISAFYHGVVSTDTDKTRLPTDQLFSLSHWQRSFTISVGLWISLKQYTMSYVVCVCVWACTCICMHAHVTTDGGAHQRASIMSLLQSPHKWELCLRREPVQIQQRNQINKTMLGKKKKQWSCQRNMKSARPGLMKLATWTQKAFRGDLMPV